MLIRIAALLAVLAACYPTEPAQQQAAAAACADRGTFNGANLPARNPAYARLAMTGNRLAKDRYQSGFTPVPAISTFATEIEAAPLGFWGTTYRRSMLTGLGIANFRNLTFGAALTPMATPFFPGPFANQMIEPASAIRNAIASANPTKGVQLRTVKEYIDAYRKAARGEAGGMPVTDVAEELIKYAEADTTDDDRLNMLIYRPLADGPRIRAAARDAEQRYQNEAAGLTPGPRALEGVFVVVKDQIDVATIPTTVGTRWRATVPAADATVVANLKAHGAIVLSKSNMSEIGGNITGYNPYWGPVRNAYDKRKVGGGSSGGSAVAVATGLVPIAIGSDAGGSIRIPAGGNGVYGLKPTYGRMSQTGVYPLSESLSAPGPMANTPGDLAALYIAMAGVPNDCKFGGGGLLGPADLGNFWGPGKKLQIGVYEAWNNQAAPAIRTKVSDAIARLVKLGADQRRIDPMNFGIPKLEWALVAQLMTYATDARTTVTGDAAYRANQATAEQRITVAMGATVATNVANPTHLSSCAFMAGQAPCDVQRAQLIRRELKEALDQVFCDAGVDVIATFTIGQPMPPVRDAAATPNGGSASPDGESDLREMDGIGLTNALANLTGHPAITIPIGYVNDMPVGLQLIGREWSECDLMNIALDYDGFTRVRPQTTYDPLTPSCSCSSDDECETATCATSGACVLSAVADGSACTEGTCVAGACTASCDVSCDDANECTEEACAGASCTSSPLPSTTPCSGGACDGDGTCVAFTCSASCDDGNPCTADYCDAFGCESAPLDDGTPCPGGTCFEGACGGDACAGVTCTSTNECIDVGCNPTTGACDVTTYKTGSCANGTGYCSAGVCVIAIGDAGVADADAGFDAGSGSASASAH